MANEVDIVTLLGYPPGEPDEATVAAGTNISKGTWLVWADADTVVASSAIRQSPAGVASMDKDANDPSTKISFYTNFVGDMVAVSTTDLPLVGYPVELSGANLIRLPRVDQNNLSGAEFISGAAFFAGKARETASSAERIMVRVRL